MGVQTPVRPDKRLSASAGLSLGTRTPTYEPHKQRGASVARRQPHDAALEVYGEVKRALRQSRSAHLPLANGAFHLDLDQTVHLDRVLEWELFDDRFDEAGDDHRRGL